MGNLHINGTTPGQSTLDFEEIEYEVAEYIQVQQSENNFRSFIINLKIILVRLFDVIFYKIISFVIF